ncbi:MAG TPA: type IV secretion system DNA-binding domain-containing protein [Fimbriimonadaceae bacterium]|jgi:hypothetical protein
MDWLFRFLEAPLIWLSHRSTPKSKLAELAPRNALGVCADDIPFSLSESDLGRHAYILGSTGCGKTSLILALIEEDIRREHSFVVVDHRGDLVAGALGLCDTLDIDPEKITLLDLREQHKIQGFNPLAGAGEPYIRALHVLDVLADEAESWGVQLEETLRSALILLSEAREPITKLELLFYDSAFRSKCLSRCTDTPLLTFWERYAAMSKDKQQAWALPVLNKVTSLLAVPVLREVLGSASGLDLGELLNRKGHILLVSLAVDELHRSGRMVGSLVVSAISREMLGRVNVPESARNPVRLYVDEFENMASESFESLIAEGRRFALSLVLSHQTLNQLPARLRSVVRNNVGVQMLFQVGFEDAKQVLNELPKEFTLEDIRRLGIGQAIVLNRNGTAQTIQFKKPRPPKPRAAIDAFRERVLASLPLATAFDNKVDKPDEAPEQLGLEDWLCD